MLKLNVPINRVVAFAGPYISILSGAVADWLLVHVHLLSDFHTTKGTIVNLVTQGLVFGLTAILTWLGHQKWLTGWQAAEARQGGTMATEAPEPTAPPEPTVTEPEPEDEPTPDAEPADNPEPEQTAAGEPAEAEAPPYDA